MELLSFKRKDKNGWMGQRSFAGGKELIAEIILNIVAEIFCPSGERVRVIQARGSNLVYQEARTFYIVSTAGRSERKIYPS